MRCARLGGWLVGCAALIGLSGCGGGRPKLESSTDELGVAISLLEKKDFAAAVHSAANQIQKTPKAATAYYFRAEANQHLGHSDQAFADYSDFIRLTIASVAGDSPLTLPKPTQAQLVRAYCFRGSTFLDRGQVGLAKTELGNVIDIDPNFAQAYYLRARAVRDRPIPASVIEDGEMAIRLDPTRAEYYQLLADAYCNIKAPNYELAKEYNEHARRLNPTVAAIGQPHRVAFGTTDGSPSAADAAPTLSPSEKKPSQTKVRELVEKGLEQSKNGKWDEATQSLTDALDLDPNSIESLAARGNAFLERGFPDSARADFARVVYLRPDHAEAFLGLTIADFRLGKYYRAAEEGTSALRLKPNSALAHEFRGKAYVESKEGGPALADLDEAIRLDPKLAEPLKTWKARAFYVRGVDHFNRKEWANAQDDLEKAKELDPALTVQHSDLDRKIKAAEEKLNPAESPAPRRSLAPLFPRKPAEKN